MEPTITTPEDPTVTEDPTDTPAEEPGEIEVDSVEIMADEVAAHTVSIKDYSTVKKLVTFSGAEVVSGKITVNHGAGLTLTATVKEDASYKIKEMKSGETKATVASGGASATLTLSAVNADAEVEITLKEIYTLSVTDGDPDTNDASITLDKSLGEAAGGTADTAVTVTEAASVTIEKGSELKFTVTPPADADKRLKVYYIADPAGDDDDADEKGIKIETTEDPTTHAKINTCKVSADTINNLNDSIRIKLVVEEKKAVTITPDVADNIQKIEVEVEKADGTGKEYAEYSADADTGNNKAFPGETFNFKVTAKAPYAVKAVKDGDTTIEPNDNIYSLTVGDSGNVVTVETELAATGNRTLKFELTGDPKSAAAAITSVKPAATTEAPNPAAITAAAVMAEALGITEAQLTLTGEPVRVKKDGISEIEVTVTPAAAKGYKLVAGTGETLEENGTLKKIYKDATLTDDIVVNATTAAVASATDTYFTIMPVDADSLAAGETVHVVLNVDAKAEGDTTGPIVKTATTDTAGLYKVIGGADRTTVSFKITADKGWTYTGLDETKVASVKEAPGAEGKTEYTVTLNAKVLGADESNPVDLGMLQQKEITFNAEITPAENRKFNVSVEKKAATAGAAYEESAEATPIKLGESWKATIVPTGGTSLEKVAWKMGEGEEFTDAVISYNDEDPEDSHEEAVVEIPEVTGNITIQVTSGDRYTLAPLGDASDDSERPEPDDVAADGSPVYDVAYDGSYLVGVLVNGEGIASAKDLSVVVKADGAEVLMSIPARGGKRLVSLKNRDFAGKELSVEVSYKGEAVGRYILRVANKTTSITLKDSEDKEVTEINLDVGTEQTYTIETTGEIRNISVAKDGKTDADDTFASDIVDIDQDPTGSKLTVTVAPAAFDDVVTRTPGANGAASTDVHKTAVITISADDDPDVQTKIEVTANPVFDKEAKPEVISETKYQADTVINATVNMSNVKTPESGSLWYEVTAEAVTTRGSGADAESWAGSDASEVLEQTVIRTVRRTGDSQRVELNLGKDGKGLGEGAEWDYKVTAKLVYVKPRSGRLDSNIAIPAEKQIEATESSAEKTITTQKPSFTDTLRLRKGKKTTLSTGQRGEFVIATPSFTTKFDSYEIVSDQIIDSCGEYDEGGNWINELDLGVNSNGDIVVYEVPEWATLGKHTITVTATADESAGHTMYASRATIKITIVKGVNVLALSTPTYSVYKQDNRAATLKTTLQYNLGQWNMNGKKEVYNAAPKKKTVKWRIVGAETESPYDIVDAPKRLKSDSPKANDNVTIKNGTVSIGAKFEPDDTYEKNNQFRVLVEALDEDGNFIYDAYGAPVFDITDTITITKNKMAVDKIVLAALNDEGKYKVVAVQDGKKVQDAAAKDVDGAYVLAVGSDSDAKLNNTYTYNQLWSRLKIADPASMTVKANNKKLLEIKKDTESEETYNWPQIKILGAGKKVNITVTANDGGRNKGTLPLNLGYTDCDGKEVALRVRAVADASANCSYEDTNYVSGRTVFAGDKAAKAAEGKEKYPEKQALSGISGALRLEVQLMAKYSSSFAEADRLTNYKLSASGGKIVKTVGSTVYVLTNKADTTLTLTIPAAKKGERAKVYTYVLTNSDFAKALKAPKVKVNNSLHQDGTPQEQTLSMSVLDSANRNEPYAKGKAVKVEIDWTKETAKNSVMLHMLDQNLSSGAADTHVFALEEENGKVTGEVKLPVANYEYDDYDEDGNYLRTYYDYTPGSYKVRVTVGTLSGSTFTAETLPASATIKVTKDKTFTFKPVTSYTINKMDGGAVLTGKSNVSAKQKEATYIYFENLQNVNQKGSSNQFTHYFTIREDELTHTQRIVLNTEDPLVQKMIYEPQKDAQGAEIKDAQGNVLYTDKLKENPAIEIDREDLTGYVTYHAWPNVGYYANSGRGVSGTVKITVKIAADPKSGKAKPSEKYAADTANIAKASGSTTEVNIRVNGAYISVKDAIVDASKANKNAAEIALNTPAVNDKGQICLKAAQALDTEKRGGYSTNLLIIPTSSYYAAFLEGKNAEDKKKLIETYGIPVKVTVIAKEKLEEADKTPDPTIVDDGNGEEEEPTPETDVVATAKTALSNWVNGLETNADSKTWLKNDNNLQTTLLSKAGTAAGSDVTVTFSGAPTVTPASVSAAGSISGTFTLTQDTDETNTDTLPFNIPIPKGAVVIADAKTAISGIVSGGSITGIDIKDDSDVATIINAIVQEAQGAIGSEDYYTVSGPADTSSITFTADSTVEIVITVTPKDDSSADTVTLTLNVGNSNGG